MRDENRLERALAEYLRWREGDAAASTEAFLAAHADLRDLLEPMVTDTPVPPAGTTGFAGKMVGEYRIVREIGRGGMGVVFEAQQVALGRRVALKVLGSHLTLSATSVARFRREASTAARLHHPGIVQVYGMGSDGDCHYFAMDYVEGAPLDRVLKTARTGPIATATGRTILAAISETPSAEVESIWNKSYVEAVVDLVTQIADALEHAHRAGVIHRDVKPSNVLVREDGTALLADFGLARQQGLPSITATGEFAGTPYYVSPEQAMAGRAPIDPRSDIFSLGSMLFELVTLQLPFTGANSQEVLGKIAVKDPADPQKLNPLLSGDLAAITTKALEKDPDKRYQSAAEMAADLRAFRDYRPVQARRITTAVRVRRWIRRHPVQATVTVALPLLLLASAAMGGYLLARQPEIAAGREKLLADTIDKLLQKGFMQVLTATRAQGFATLSKVLELAPDNPEAIVGILHVSNMDKRETLEFLDHHHHRGSEPRALDLFRARALRSLGNRAEADALESSVPEPRTAQDLFLTGIFHLPLPGRSGTHEEFVRALELFHAAIYRSHTANFLHYYWLAFAASRCGNAAAAHDCAAALLTLWPDDEAAAIAAGVALSFIDNQGAVDAFERALEINPDSYFALRNMSLAQSSSGQLEAAIETSRRAVARRPSDGSMSSILAMQLVRARRYREGIEIGLESLRHTPSHLGTYNVLGAAYDRLGEHDKALPYFQRAIELAPTHGRAHRNLMYLYTVLGDVAGKLAEAQRWIEVHPGNPEPLGDLAEWVVCDQPSPTPALIAEAVTAAEQAAVLSRRRNGGFLLDLAGALALAGRQSEATTALRDARAALTAAAPESPVGWHEFADWTQRHLDHATSEQLEMMLAAAEKAVALAPAPTADQWFTVAATRQRCGDTPAAMVAFRNAREAIPDDAASWLEFAELMVTALQQPTAAQRLLAVDVARAAAQRCGDDDVTSAALLGRALAAAGERDEATRVLARARALLRPDMPRWYPMEQWLTAGEHDLR